MFFGVHNVAKATDVLDKNASFASSSAAESRRNSVRNIMSLSGKGALKESKRLSVGYYRLSSEHRFVRYVYVPGKLMRSSAFNLGLFSKALSVSFIRKKLKFNFIF
jgi:hypothetical protein